MAAISSSKNLTSTEFAQTLARTVPINSPIMNVDDMESVAKKVTELLKEFPSFSTLSTEDIRYLHGVLNDTTEFLQDHQKKLHVCYLIGKTPDDMQNYLQSQAHESSEALTVSEKEDGYTFSIVLNYLNKDELNEEELRIVEKLKAQAEDKANFEGSIGRLYNGPINSCLNQVNNLRRQLRTEERRSCRCVIL